MDDTHFPALEALETSFNDHMAEFHDGIPTSEGFVYWLQRMGVLTLGHIDDRELVRLFADPYASNAILLGQPAQRPRRDPGETPLETRSDQRFRFRLEAHVFSPAFRRGYNDLKTNATEYLEDAPPGVSKRGAPALRPSIDELAGRQAGVLGALFQDSGFDSEQAISKWSRDVVAGTRGHISGDELRRLTIRERDPFLHATLLNEEQLDETARANFLQLLAARLLLPLFNSAVRDLAQTAGEISEDQTTGSMETVDV